MIKKVLSYFWVFILTSHLGFVIETIWCLIKNKKIESRKGLIYEPMIPIYGISGTLIVLTVRVFNLNEWYEIFIVGFLLSTIVEFFASLLQEKIFETKSWDYTHFRFNLGGRVNLYYSLMFGTVALVSYKLILDPFFNLFMDYNINMWMIIVSIFMLVFMIYDFAVSSIAVYRMKERKNNIERDGKLWNYIDKKYPDSVLKKIYANMVDV